MAVRTGGLEPLKLFKVLRSLLKRQATGMLQLRRGERRKQIEFIEGAPVRVYSNDPGEAIGRWLVEEGVISSSERISIEQACEGQGADALAQTLLSRGLIAQTRLAHLQHRLERHRLLEAFAWPDGELAFQPRAVTLAGDRRPMDVIDLLIEAAARAIADPICLQFVRPFEPQDLHPTPWLNQHREVFDRFFPNPNLRALIDRPRGVAGLMTVMGDTSAAARQISALVLSGMATFRAPGSTPQSVAPQPHRRPIAHPSRPPLRKPPATPSPHAAGRAVRLSARPQPIQPSPSATPPPTPARPQMPPAAPEERQEPASSGLTGRMPTSVASNRASQRATSSKRARNTGAQKVAPTMPDEIRARLKEAETLAPNIEKATHYEVLRIERDADSVAIRTAFRKLARDFHVDRFKRYRPSQAAVANIQKVFIAINRAHEILSDSAERHEYDLSLTMGAKVRGSQPMDIAREMIRAEKLVIEGVKLLQNGKADQALEHMSEALSITPEDPLAQGGRAYAEFLKVQGKGGSAVIAARTREVLEAITADYKDREEPFLWLGRVYRAQGEYESAATCFKKTLEINEHCIEARSDLRHVTKKGGLETPASTTKQGLRGLFGRRK